MFEGAAERSHQREFEGENEEAEGAGGEVSTLRGMWTNHTLPRSSHCLISWCACHREAAAVAERDGSIRDLEEQVRLTPTPTGSSSEHRGGEAVDIGVKRCMCATIYVTAQGASSDTLLPKYRSL